MTYLSHVVSREVACVHAKLNISSNADSHREARRWSESAALREPGVSRFKKGASPKLLTDTLGNIAVVISQIFHIEANIVI